MAFLFLSGNLGGYSPATTLANYNKYFIIIVLVPLVTRHCLVLRTFRATKHVGKSQTGKSSQVSSDLPSPSQVSSHLFEFQVMSEVMKMGDSSQSLIY